MKGMIRMKVRTSSASAKGARVSRSTYRSSVRIAAEPDCTSSPCHPPRPARPAVAHAPAVLPRPVDRGVDPAVGAAPRAEGLLGHGRDGPGGARACGSPSTWCRRSSSRSRRTPSSAPGTGTSSSDWPRPRPVGAADAEWFVREGFHAHAPTMIQPYPRYAELAAMRLRAAPSSRPPTCAICRCGRSWPGSTPTCSPPTPARCGWWGRAATSTSTTRRALRALELDVLRRVIPSCREAASSGQVELSTSPYFHPILPLAVRLGGAPRRAPDRAAAGPAVSLSRRRGAAAARGPSTAHRRWFGEAPAGVWPSEGSVSDAGGHRNRPRRVAMDGERRGDSGPLDVARAARRADRAAGPTRWRRRPGKSASCFATTPCRTWSGFTYQGWSAEAAAADFLARVRDAGRRASAHGRGRSGGAGDPRRRERLGALRRRRPAVPAGAVPALWSRRRDMAPVGMRAAAEGPARPLSSIFAGLVDQRRLRDLDRPPRRPPGLGTARARPGPDTAARTDAPAGRPGPRRSTRSSPPRAATGAGGTATTTRRRTTGSSTRCSAATCRASTPRSASRSRRRLHRHDHHDQHRARRPRPAGPGRSRRHGRRRTSSIAGSVTLERSGWGHAPGIGRAGRRRPGRADRGWAGCLRRDRTASAGAEVTASLEVRRSPLDPASEWPVADSRPGAVGGARRHAGRPGSPAGRGA